MKNQVVSTGTVLTRINFQEADRIITILTPDHGKVRLIAKGVRRTKSKLAGGIELFSVSNITYLPGKGDIGTLVSSRLITHFENIAREIQRTMLGYEFLKRLNRATEDAAGREYYDLIVSAMDGLNDLDLPYNLTDLWFSMQLLKVSGQAPNLKTDVSGKHLDPKATYLFSHDRMAFKKQPKGPYSSNHIKLLRLAYGIENPSVLKQVKDAAACMPDALQLTKSILSRHIRV